MTPAHHFPLASNRRCDNFAAFDTRVTTGCEQIRLCPLRPWNPSGVRYLSGFFITPHPNPVRSVTTGQKEAHVYKRPVGSGRRKTSKSRCRSGKPTLKKRAGVPSEDTAEFSVRSLGGRGVLLRVCLCSSGSFIRSLSHPIHNQTNL